MSAIPTPEQLYRESAALPGGEPSILGGVVDHEWREVRVYERAHEEGARAVVWVSRFPAQFYRLTTGDIEITTGSGAEIGVLMCRLANEISQGDGGVQARAVGEGCAMNGAQYFFAKRRQMQERSDFRRRGHVPPAVGVGTHRLARCERCGASIDTTAECPGRAA
jgi:hypothetical protein